MVLHRPLQRKRATQTRRRPGARAIGGGGAIGGGRGAIGQRDASRGERAGRRGAARRVICLNHPPPSESGVPLVCVRLAPACLGLGRNAVPVGSGYAVPEGP